ncbi:hypothetical protein [Nonomuraea pusilla]|uniref:WXG100-like domain-containing protein n=1 Tax=Nonomuraea pusilla TaxID=46177 RepID=UPI000B816AF4|nr:hypothetical protein [Nonomuraea pusilla]
MWLDGVPIPSWARPWVGWVVGMDWPQAREADLFALADELVAAARDMARGAHGGRLPGEPDPAVWDGEALRAFAAYVNDRIGGGRADVVARLVRLAVALNDLGVQVQYTKRMIKLSVLLLVVQIGWLLWALLTPGTSGVAFSAMVLRARAARMTVRQLGKRLLFNIALFGALMGGMDLYLQASQRRRDGIDVGQLLGSVGTGMLTGALLTGVTWLRPPRSLLGLMGESALAGGAATLVTQVASGQPLDWEAVLKGATAGGIGMADAHWASWGGAPAHHASSGPGGAPGHGAPSGPDGAPSGASSGASPGPDATRLARALPSLDDLPPEPSGHLDALLNRDGGGTGAVGEPVRLPLPAGRETVRAELIDGRHGAEVEKEFSGAERRDREHFGSKLGRALGADVAPTRITGDRTVRVGWVGGEEPVIVRRPGGAWEVPGHDTTRHGVLMGALDTVTSNHDRLGNGPGGSGLRVEHGVLRGFDHDKVLEHVLPDTANPMVRHFFRETEPGGLPRFVDNPLHPRDIEVLRPRVETVLQEMRAAGRGDWAANAAYLFGKIAEHASGPVPILDAPPGVPLAFSDAPTAFTGLGDRATVPAAPSPDPGIPGGAPHEPTGTPSGVRARPPDPDPDTRTPHRLVYPERELAVLRDGRAYAVDPGSALQARQWAHLRADAPVRVLDRRTGVPEVDGAAHVEVRRFRLDAGDVTELSVRVRHVTAPGLDEGALALLKRRAAEAADLFFNHRHRLSDGSQLHVRLTFEEVANAAPGADGVVTFAPGHGRSDALTWHAAEAPDTLAHEISHLLALPDEYRHPGEPGRRTPTSAAVPGDPGLMGDALRHQWWASGELMADRAGRPVVQLSGLRDRHLAALEHLVRLDDPLPAARGEAAPRGGFAERTRGAERLVLPAELRDLDRRFPAAPGTDPVGHARRLERVHHLFGGEDVTSAHLAYTDALTDAAALLYGKDVTVLGPRDFLRFHRLATLLGGTPDHGMPYGFLIRGMLGDALGGREHVTARTVEGLARLAEWFTADGGRTLPRDNGAGVLRRAAGELLGEPPGAETARRAAVSFAYAGEHSYALAAGTADLRALTDGLRRLRASGGEVSGPDLAHLADLAHPPGPAVPRASPDGPGRGPLAPDPVTRAALREGQNHAYALDPRHAVRAEAWEQARADTVPEQVEGGLPGAADVELRRMWARGPDGTLRPVSEFTVTVRYQAQAGMTPDELAALRSDVRDAVDLHFNHQHTLPLDGSQLHVRVEFEPAPPGTRPEQRIGLRRADRTQQSGTMSFSSTSPLVTHAQRVGHMLGLDNEYRVHGDGSRRPATDDAPRDASLMGANRRDLAYPHAHSHALRGADGRPLPALAGLRDRHLVTLGGHLLRGFPSAVEVPLHRLGRPEPLEPSAWQGPAPVERKGLPKHVRTLLDTGRFPQGDRPLADHVQRLDRAATLFLLSGPGGGLRLPDLMPRHLDYVDALTETGRQAFGAGPQHPYTTPELTRLHALVWQLGGGPESRAPDAAWLHGSVNALLGRPPEHVVTAAEVRYLGWVAAGGEPPGQQARRGVLPELLVRALDGYEHRRANPLPPVHGSRARSQTPDPPLTVRAAVGEATPAERAAAPWGDRAEAVAAASPRDGESSPLGALRGEAREPAVRAWLERVTAFTDPVTGVRGRLDDLRLTSGRAEFTVALTPAYGGPPAYVRHTLELGPGGRAVATHGAPEFSAPERLAPIERQAVELAWRLRLEQVENLLVAAGATELNARPLTPPRAAAPGARAGEGG